MQQKLLQSAKILERMLNLNTFDDIAQVPTKYIISSFLQCFCNHHSDPLSPRLPIRTFVTGTTLETNFVFQLVFSSLCGSVFSFEIVKSKDKRQLSKIRKVFRILTSKLKASLRSQQLVGTRNTGGE